MACYVCLAGEDAGELVLTTCACRMRVHAACLQRELEARGAALGTAPACTVCRTPYHAFTQRAAPVCAARAFRLGMAHAVLWVLLVLDQAVLLRSAYLGRDVGCALLAVTLLLTTRAHVRAWHAYARATSLARESTMVVTVLRARA